VRHPCAHSVSKDETCRKNSREKYDHKHLINNLTNQRSNVMNASVSRRFKIGTDHFWDGGIVSNQRHDRPRRERNAGGESHPGLES